MTLKTCTTSIASAQDRVLKCMQTRRQLLAPATKALDRWEDNQVCLQSPQEAEAGVYKTVTLSTQVREMSLTTSLKMNWILLESVVAATTVSLALHKITINLQWIVRSAIINLITRTMDAISPQHRTREQVMVKLSHLKRLCLTQLALIIQSKSKS